MKEIAKEPNSFQQESHPANQRPIVDQTKVTEAVNSEEVAKLLEDREKITALHEQVVEQIDQGTTIKEASEDSKPEGSITPSIKTSNDSNFFYSKIARFFDLVQILSGYKLAVRYFIGMIPFETKQSIKVLDAGCGTGLFTFALLRRFPNASIKAFDLNNDMIQRMSDTAHRNSLKQKI